MSKTYSLRKRVSNNIKQLRAKRGFTQEEAAERSNVHYKYYQRVEAGDVNLTLDSIEKIAKAFGVMPKKLLP